MTTTAKRFVTLNDQIENAQSKASKFESGHSYDPIKYAVWNDKANVAQEKQNALTLSEEDQDSISSYYECEMF